MTGRFTFKRAALPALFAGAAAIAFPASAQSGDTVSRAVVQPLPPAAADDLNGALMRLAKDRRDVDALIAAGLASLELDDIDAAIGFFGRARELSPENPRISEGMGAAYVRGGRPVEALRFFEEAEEAGINTGSLWADRGLAYDLVGQNETAQTAYRRALSLDDDSAVRLRLALSYAISGERRPFEDTLKPLLDARDFAAYRTRAFGLAVLGEADEAIEIARAVMPRDLAGRMEPYLRFMPRLTKSQQAAAANLGIYPSASRIGRDDPRIASAAGVVAAPGTSDAALEPRGAQLGGQDTARVASSQQATEVRTPPPSLRRTRTPPRVSSASQAAPESTPEATAEVAQQSPVRDLRGVLPARQGPQPTLDIGGPPVLATPVAQAAPAADPPSVQEPTRVAAATQGQPESSRAEASSFDLAQAQQPEQAAAAAPSGPVDLADAFADFTTPTSVAVAGGDVVDISSIEPVREEAEPEPPPAPRRIWLQLGIGQDRSLLRGDWRLKYRKFDAIKDKGPFVTSWGQTNRLLAGPFDSQSDAREALNALAAEDVDAFVWTSAEGQEIDELR